MEYKLNNNEGFLITKDGKSVDPMNLADQVAAIKQNGITGTTRNCYAICSTVANDPTKTATVTAGTPTLEAGLHVFVKFSYANKANSPTLNINSTGAKAIYYNGDRIYNEYAGKYMLSGVCEFVYDGTYWNLINNIPYFGADGTEIWINSSNPYI
jgi:hypothetical protein